MRERTLFGVPRVPDGALTRRVLQDRIGRSPLTVVRGPGGRGKTVLMSQWASSWPGAGVWVAVQPHEGDRRAFWAAVAEAGAREDLELGMPDPVGAPHDPALRPALVAAFRRLRRPFALAIDDAQRLGDPRVFDDLLEILHACPDVVVVVATRTQGGLEAPRHALALDVELIGPDELLLGADEIESLGGRGAVATAELLEASGGNPLLVRAVLAGAPGSDPRESISAIVGDVLAGVFARSDAELADFAAAVAVPDEVDASLAGRISGVDPDRAVAMFDALESEGLLLRGESPEAPRFRYHSVVREALCDDLRRRHPERYRRLSLLASAAAEAEGRFHAALAHAVDAEDYARASDVCLHGGMTLLRSPGAGAILQRVPMRYVARLPFIAIVLGLAANLRGERFRALELMTLALGASRASRGRQRPAERIGLALIESSALRVTGRAAESMGAARRMASLIDRAPAAELEEIADQLDSYRLQGALSLFRGGALSEARLAAERAGASAHALSTGRPAALGAASVVASVQAIRGEARAAAQTLARVEESSYSSVDRNGYVGSLSHLARGILALEHADGEMAEREVDTLRDHVNLEYLMLLEVLRALSWLWRGQAHIGLELLGQREGTDRPRARMSRQDRQALAAGRALLQASLGRLGAARVALRALDRSDPIGTVLEAALLLLEQRPDLVLERLGRGNDLPGPRLQATADVLRACAAQLEGDDELAESALGRFLAVVDVHDVTSPFVLIPAAHRPALLALVERMAADPDVVDRLRAVPAPFDATGTRVVLTPREAEVLEALRTDASHAEVARALSVSVNTVRSQVRSLYRKLGVSQRDEALRAAYLQGLLERPTRERPGRAPNGG